MTHLINPQGSSTSQGANKFTKNITDPDTPVCKCWNLGKCMLAACWYKHICSKCWAHHQAKDCTKTALLFPHVTVSELQNSPSLQTISSRPDLFKIVTTVNAKKLDELLTTHPNQALIDSVCPSLRENVWPFMNINPAAPETFDGSWCRLNAKATQFT